MLLDFLFFLLFNSLIFKATIGFVQYLADTIYIFIYTVNHFILCSVM